MKAIADCSNTIKGLGNHDATAEMHDLQQIVKNTSPTLDEHCNPVSIPVAPRVDNDAADNDSVRITRSMTQGIPEPRVAHHQTLPAASPRVVTTPTSRPRRIKSRRRRSVPPQTTPPTAPASNTRSRTKAAAQQQAHLAAPPAKSTRASKRLTLVQRQALQTTPAKWTSKMRKRLNKLESEVHRALAVMDAQTGQMLNYRQLMRHPDHKGPWSLSSANEFGRLANGVGGRIKNPTNTIKFIHKHEVPRDRRKDVTYGQFVCTVRPEKAESNRTRFTVGGDRINYPGEVATPTADMLVAKLLFNSVISTKDAKFMTLDISNFYLMTPLKRPEFIRMKLSDIPDEIIREYKLRDKATPDGSIYIVANKGMYGLPQAGLLANELLEKRLNKHGYHQSKLVPGLWKHEW